jgi:hypothetical protein
LFGCRFTVIYVIVWLFVCLFVCLFVFLFGSIAVRFVLLVLDFSVCPSNVILEGLIKATCDLLHGGPQYAALVMMPHPYSGLATATLLAHQRRIEDRLMLHGATIEHEIMIHYDDTNHGNDKRQLSTRARLCLSSRTGDKSQWLSSPAARGKMSGIPLVRVRDMRTLREQFVMVVF